MMYTEIKWDQGAGVVQDKVEHYQTTQTDEKENKYWLLSVRSESLSKPQHRCIWSVVSVLVVVLSLSCFLTLYKEPQVKMLETTSTRSENHLWDGHACLIFCSCSPLRGPFCRPVCMYIFLCISPVGGEGLGLERGAGGNIPDVLPRWQGAPCRRRVSAKLGAMVTGWWQT